MMKMLIGLFTLMLVACVEPNELGGPIMCPACGPHSGDSCRQYSDGYQCGACVCTDGNWNCWSSDGGAVTCPARNPTSGESCTQFPDRFQCGPCVCDNTRWTCYGGADGGGQVMCPKEGVKSGESCSQFSDGYQCGACVCKADLKWSC